MPRLPRSAGAACPTRRASAPRGSAAGRSATWARARATATAWSPSAGPAVAQPLRQLAHLGAAGELQEQLLQARVARAMLPPQVVHRALGHDLAVLDDGDAVAHRLGHLERVGAHEHGAAPARELPENVLQQSRRLRVEPDHRLVHHDVLGPMDQRARDDQLLAHPVAVRLDQLVLPARQLEHLEQLGDPPVHGVTFLAVQGRHEPQELGPRELVVHERPVRDEAEPLFGRDPIAAKQRLGFIPDRPFVYDKLTGAEFLRFVAALYGQEGDTVDRRVAELLEVFELTSWKDELVEAYSHGMRQKLIISSALIHRPEYIVVDEPMVGLDPKAARLLKDIFRQFASRGGTVLMSTHTLEVAEAMCDRVAIIQHGKIVAEGTVDDLRRQHRAGDASLEELFLKLTGGAQVRELAEVLGHGGDGAP